MAGGGAPGLRRRGQSDAKAQTTIGTWNSGLEANGGAPHAGSPIFKKGFMPRLKNALEQVAKTPPHSRVSVYLVVLLGLVSTFATSYAVQRASTERSRRALARQAEDLVLATDARITRYDGALLQMNAFLTVKGDVRRNDFDRFFEKTRLMKRYPGLVGLGSIVSVGADERDEFERTRKEDGTPDYHIWPGGERDEYLPVEFFAPETPENASVFGFDMGTSPERARAMTIARDTGEAQMTSVVTLMQDRNAPNMLGFLLFRARYDNEPQTLAERREQLVGYVYAPIRATSLFNELMSELEMPKGLALEVVDEDGRTLFRTGGALDDPSAFSLRFSEEIAGRAWDFHFVMPLPPFSSRAGTVLLVFLLGCGLTLVLYRIVDDYWQKAESERQSGGRERAYRGFIEDILDTTRALMVVIDDEYRVVYFNREAEEVTGWTRDEIRGLKWPFEFLPESEKERLNHALLSLRTGQGGILYEGPIRTRSGEERIIAWRNAMTEDATGGMLFFIAAGMDVTNFRHVEAERQQLLEQSQRDVEDLRVERELTGRFVATLTHDLRTPLGAARMNAQLLLRKDPESKRLVRIVTNIDRADRMIQDLLDVHRSRAIGETPALVMEECDLANEVRETLDDLASMLGPRFEFHAPASVVGYWNAKGLRRVVENLATNAVKYGEADAPVVITLTPSDVHVSLSVHNCGNPIPPDELEGLFRSFVRAKSAKAGAIQGWGIGMTVIQDVTRAHGGRVNVTSTEEGGTTFTIDLPLDARGFGPDAGATNGGTPPPPGANTPSKGERRV